MDVGCPTGDGMPPTGQSAIRLRPLGTPALARLSPGGQSLLALTPNVSGVIDDMHPGLLWLDVQVQVAFN